MLHFAQNMFDASQTTPIHKKNNITFLSSKSSVCYMRLKDLANSVCQKFMADADDGLVHLGGAFNINEMHF